jgi:hypothetical protein
MKTFPQILYISAHLTTAKNTKLVWKRDESALYTPLSLPLVNEKKPLQGKPK